MADKELDIQVIVAGPQEGIKAHGSRIIVQGSGGAPTDTDSTS